MKFFAFIAAGAFIFLGVTKDRDLEFESLVYIGIGMLLIMLIVVLDEIDKLKESR